MKNHPEGPPEIPPTTRFMFNVDMAANSEQDLTWRIEALEERVSRIVQRTEISSPMGGGRVPILMFILSQTHDAEELRVLARALERVGPLLQELDELRSRKNLIEFAKANPNWVAGVFGEFSEVDNDAEDFTATYGDVDPS